MYDITMLGTRDLNGAARLRDSQIDLGVAEWQVGNNPLPVTLVSFTGKFLSWQTTLEKNTHSFAIERSWDGKFCETAGAVKANFSGAHSYTFTDAKMPLKTMTYYRLKMIDLDGSHSYSTIITVKPNGEKPGGLSVYPNPMVRGGNITLESQQSVTATIYSLAGKEIRNIELKAGRNEINMGGIATGIYLITTESGATTKVVVVD